MNRDWKPRGLRIEHLEERLALSAATGVALDLQSFSSSGPLNYAPNEGGLVDIAATLSMAGNAKGTVGLAGSGGIGNDALGSSTVGIQTLSQPQSNGFNLLNSNILFDAVGDRDKSFIATAFTLDLIHENVGQNAGNQIPHISPPLPSEELGQEGGNIELTEILYPLPTYSESDKSLRSAELQRHADVGFPFVEPTSKTPASFSGSAALSAIQGRDIAFEVATHDSYDQTRLTQHNRTEIGRASSRERV